MRPDSIRKFDLFYLAAVAISIASALLNFDTQVAGLGEQLSNSGLDMPAETFLLISLGIAFAINMLLWFCVSRLRMGWVKWVILVFVIYSIVTLASAMAMGLASLSITGVLTVLLKAIALSFLFRADAKEWFAKGSA